MQVARWVENSGEGSERTESIGWGNTRSRAGLMRLTEQVWGKQSRAGLMSPNAGQVQGGAHEHTRETQ